MTDTVAPPGWDLERSPFHDGELSVQDRVGVRDKIDAQGRRAVRRYFTEQHREFFALLPYVFAGSIGSDGQPWASMLVGQPGFVQSPNPQTLTVAASPLFGDPLKETLEVGAPLALLGVQLPTRRRNRAIGMVSEGHDGGFTLAVRQTLGVCPQYIQDREMILTGDGVHPATRPVYRADRLDDAARAIIERADTFFVASVDPRAEDGVAAGPDVSHRGGRPGFVRVDDERTITTPDFVGNFIFNTLGNFQIDDRAGLLFVDFERADMLYLAARAEVIWDGPEVRAFVGAQRLVRYRLTEVIRVEGSLPARFSSPDYSPLLARTGTWQEAARTLEAERLRTVWRPFRVVEVVDESASIRSFRFEPADGGGVAPYAPGQFLPIRVHPEGWAEPATRTYTLSDAPDGRGYRISVKRECRGGVSDWLHDHAVVGARIEALAPRGGFVFDESAERAVVLISAGVGITPMIAILNSLLVNNGRTRLHKSIHFIHAARNAREQAFAAHLAEKAKLHSNMQLHLVHSAPEADAERGTSHHHAGRIDRALLQRLLPLDDYEVYLCGPPGFMAAIYDAMLSLGLRDARIHLEAFGPATVTRRREAAASAADSGEGIVVEFARSARTALWRPGAGSLLDLAEANGIAALSSCRSGACGTCATRLLKGEVDYVEPPAHEIASGEALICVAHPHPGPHLDGLLDREGVTLDL